jgi:hypothetical protein
MRPLFEEPPDNLDSDWTHGVLLVRWGSAKGYDPIDVARAFRYAGARLLKTALQLRESSEAAYPILFNYRHALELYLKAIIPAQHKHRLDVLASHLRPLLTGRYPPDQIEILIERIEEFHRIDPSSTVFRYADTPDETYEHSNGPLPDPEIWVDFRHLQTCMAQTFNALETIWSNCHALRIRAPNGI